MDLNQAGLIKPDPTGGFSMVESYQEHQAILEVRASESQSILDQSQQRMQEVELNNMGIPYGPDSERMRPGNLAEFQDLNSPMEQPLQVQSFLNEDSESNMGQ